MAAHLGGERGEAGRLGGHWWVCALHWAVRAALDHSELHSGNLLAGLAACIDWISVTVQQSPPTTRSLLAHSKDQAAPRLALPPDLLVLFCGLEGGAAGRGLFCLLGHPPSPHQFSF